MEEDNAVQELRSCVVAPQSRYCCQPLHTPREKATPSLFMEKKEISSGCDAVSPTMADVEDGGEEEVATAKAEAVEEAQQKNNENEMKNSASVRHNQNGGFGTFLWFPVRLCATCTKDEQFGDCAIRLSTWGHSRTSTYWHTLSCTI